MWAKILKNQVIEKPLIIRMILYWCLILPTIIFLLFRDASVDEAWILNSALERKFDFGNRKTCSLADNSALFPLGKGFSLDMTGTPRQFPWRSSFNWQRYSWGNMASARTVFDDSSCFASVPGWNICIYSIVCPPVKSQFLRYYHNLRKELRYSALGKVNWNGENSISLLLAGPDPWTRLTSGVD